jgi:3-hydroxyacyl-[acyl-carrier-protein] dehydratase
MPPKLIYDIDTIDPQGLVFGPEKIREVNPQRGDFEHLDGIALYKPEDQIMIGFKNVREDEFWVTGHVPGRPLLPGVLMLEAAAQLCSFYSNLQNNNEYFYALGGIDEARFRGTVTPGEKLFLLAQPQTLKPVRSVFKTQGTVNGKLVFEAQILGIRLR